MKRLLRRLQHVWRQLWCRHEAYINDMRRIYRGDQRRIQINCRCCGRLLEADCGLHLPVRFVGYRHQESSSSS